MTATRVLASMALACAVATPAFAQTAAAAAASGGEIKGDIAVTYSYTRTQVHSVVQNFEKGFHISASTRFIRNINLMAELGDTFTKSGPAGHFMQYGGGVRFQTNDPDTIRPFASAFFGAAQDGAAKQNHFSVLEYGGGVDIAAGKHLAIRAQVTNPLFLFFGPVQKGIRVQFGIVIPLS